MPILHLTRTLPALLPRYLTRFSCIGPECEDSCCSGWQVTLDKKTFNAYRQSKHAVLKERFANDIKRQRSNASDLNYGRIQLKEGSQDCPFIEDRLCSVQKHLDESHLSNTCFSYPRLSRDIGGQFEQALVLSCPEAARKALLAPDAFDFVEGSITVRMESVTKITARGLSLELANDLRIFCLQLMRSDGLELWQRLAVLGVFCEQLTPAIDKGQPGEVRALLEQFTALVERGAVQEALGDMPHDHAAQAMVFSTLWARKPFGTTSAVQEQVIAAVAAGLGADPKSGQVSAEQLVACYGRGVARLPEALEAAPHLLEHYILNEMFLHLFPFDAETPFASYLQLVSRFGLLRLMLAAQCNTDGPLPDAAALVRTVQVFCRRFEHDATFAKQVNQALASSAWGKLEKLSSFLRA
jgi:lysine-N-methylase